MSEPGQVWRNVFLGIDAIDGLTASQVPNKLFRLADIAFVPDYEGAARERLLELSAQKVTVKALSDQPDFLGRTSVRIDSENVGDWRAVLLKDGLAMLLPETGQNVDDLIRAEDGAIKGRTGMWSARDPDTAYYGVADREDSEATPTARDAIGRFAVIDGEIRSIEHQEWRSYLNFGAHWREDLTIALDATIRDAFAQDEDFQSTMNDWIGQKVRVRGMVESRGGPYIAVQEPLWLCLSR
ncbi:hypothetical protein HED22_07705 [Thalassospira sp. HF15]|uniref:hypothetical protein n=1 Tax=Thalassospira sp. HF15 TaxID=2722755 RepID=UPI00143152EA|nr:hypothetical protein [Thalassospira sp. HF15]NIY75523.1 hypothetical protein [Thalassospira sp. HF15]